MERKILSIGLVLVLLFLPVVNSWGIGYTLVDNITMFDIIDEIRCFYGEYRWCENNTAFDIIDDIRCFWDDESSSCDYIRAKNWGKVTYHNETLKSTGSHYY